MERATSEQPGAAIKPADLDWDQVYLDLAPRVFNYFRFRLGSSLDVEDLTSQTFEKAWRARTRYCSDRAGFSTWLFTIAQNVFIDHARQRRSHVPMDEALQVTTDDTPEKDAAHSSDLARLATLTCDLPGRDCELIALKYGAMLTNREIARLTGLTESNVGTLLHRLVQSLRARW